MYSADPAAAPGPRRLQPLPTYYVQRTLVLGCSACSCVRYAGLRCTRVPGRPDGRGRRGDGSGLSDSAALEEEETPHTRRRTGAGVTGIRSTRPVRHRRQSRPIHKVPRVKACAEVTTTKIGRRQVCAARGMAHTSTRGILYVYAVPIILRVAETKEEGRRLPDPAGPCPCDQRTGAGSRAQPSGGGKIRPSPGSASEISAPVRGTRTPVW